MIIKNNYRTILFCMMILCVCIPHAKAQSSFALNGGFNQPIFYSSQMKSVYRHSFDSRNAYALNFTYKENFSKVQKNLQLGAQLEFKQQSAWFYYEDKFPTDTFATGVRYDIRSLNLCVFPELRVGETVQFVFSGGPVLQYIVNTKATGTQLQLISGKSNIETDINDKNSKDISGLCFAMKIKLGVEIPLCKNLYLCFSNSYTAGLTGFQGNLSKRMKYYNCLDINISGGLLWQLEHKDWFTKKSTK